MNIRVLTVGDIRTDYFVAACNEYRKRLGAYASVELVSIKGDTLRTTMSPREEQQVIESESSRLLERLDSAHFNVALDLRGKQFTSEEFAGYLDDLLVIGRSTWTFMIGGPLGLSRQIPKQSDLVLSLSRLTFPHELVPVILFEQLYRAFRIMRGEPYHR